MVKIKKKLPVVNIWNRMTVSELAESSNRSIDDIREAISLFGSAKHYNKNTVLEDEKVLYNVIRVLGAKYKLIPRPDSTEEKEKDCDVVKRYGY